MPDISMCTNKKCTLKNTCYRFRAMPKPLAQTYGTFSQGETGDCDFYWKMSADEKRQVREETSECEFCGATDPANCPHYGDRESLPATATEVLNV